ncbi:MAG TPA: hypothetical protein VF234_09680 [Limnochordia bacterium]
MASIEAILDRGRWERPSDKMAVYTEIQPGARWGIRVTLYARSALVEAIDGPSCAHYRPPKHLAAYVHPPRWWERLRGVTFEKKLLEEVERKRAVARAENGRPQGV